MSHYNPEDGGIQFDPYDDELIKRFLIPKLKGGSYPFRDKIVMKDVCAKEPWLLDHTRGSFFKKNEWYYFATRTQVSKKKTGHGQKASRKITGDNDGGTWKVNATYNIIDEETEMVIGKKQTLKFTDESNKNKKKKKRGDGTSCDIIAGGSDSSWIMTEYILPEEEDGKFQTLVLCKIHVSKKSKKKDDDHEASTSCYHHESFSSSEPQLINKDHETVRPPSVELQPINDDSFIRAYPSKHKAMNTDYESIPASPLEQQPINTICKIQEDKKDDHEALMDHQYDIVADSSSEKQPINEVHRHNPEILHIGGEKNVGSEKNDQVFETSRPKDCEHVTVKEINGEEICENLGSEKDKQLHIDAPLVFLGSQEEEEEEERDCIQQLEVSLMMMTVNGSGLPKEEDEDILIYDTSLIDQDLLDQYATLRPKESSQH